MKNTTLFDKSGTFEKYSNQTDKILEILEKFGLSKNESKIYAFIGKYGAKKIPALLLNNSTRYDLEDAKAASVVKT